MAELQEANPYNRPNNPMFVQKQATPPTLWQRFALGGVLLLSLWMNFYQLGQNGFGNLYYAAGVRSMLDNWHNFFFVSFDPGGFVSIDKPPLGFWLQVLSARVFGFTPFSVYLPQALAGILALALLYHLVYRHFGAIAALLSALVLALSPISVVTNRNNTIDSTLALVLLLGAWAVLKAAETGKLRWLVLCAVTVGLGYNIKMLEAFLVLPAFGLLYLLSAPRSLGQRLGHLAIAGTVLLAISLSWSLIVDFTPPSQRPYVGSSQNNSEISLALGYNGISRLLGQFGLAGPIQNKTSPIPQPPPNETKRFGQLQPPVPGSTPGIFETGSLGPLRLFNEPLGGQIAWLLPLSLLGMLALAWQRRPRLQQDRQQQSLLLWGMWLLTMGIFFSVAGFIHSYYLTELAPALAALFGISIVTMWHDYRHTGWRGWLLPLALLATAIEQMHILSSYPIWSQWLLPIVAIVCMIGTLVLVFLRAAWYANFNTQKLRLLVATLSITILSLLLTPAVWVAIPVLQNVQAPLPVAGPAQQNGVSSFNGANNGTAIDPLLLHYLNTNQGKATFLVATPTTSTADAIILATNKPVMALGGFIGSDPILTTPQLATLIKHGVVRFFLLNSLRPRLQPPPGFNELNNGSPGKLTSWIIQHCISVPTNLWQSVAPPNGSFSPSAVSQLYDCSTTNS